MAGWSEGDAGSKPALLLSSQVNVTEARLLFTKSLSISCQFLTTRDVST